VSAALALLDRLRAYGIRIRLVEPDRVRLEADREPPAELLTEARARKPEILEHLRRLARCGTACPDLVTCVCGAVSWRPAASTSCLQCEDRAAARNVEILLGENWVPARVASMRGWEMTVQYTVIWRGRPVTVRTLVDRCSPHVRRVVQ
jgi:hypothetical protein